MQTQCMWVSIIVLVALALIAVAILSGAFIKDDNEDAKLIGWKKQRWCK